MYTSLRMTTLGRDMARPLRLKLEAVEALNAFRAAAESESGRRIREITMDNTRELSMREMRDICKRDQMKLHTTAPYHPASNSVAEQMIGVLTNAVCRLGPAGRKLSAQLGRQRRL